MSTPVLSPLDFNRLELLNARLQNLGTDPTGLTTAEKGLLWIDGAGTIKYWDGATTKELGLATGGNAETLDGQDGLYYLARANHTGTQTAATISDLSEAVDDRVSTLIVGGTRLGTVYDDVAGSLTLNVDATGLEQTANKGVANGYASLDASGLIPSNQLPALALTDVNVVLDYVARDALTVQEGDVAIVTSTSETFIYDGTTWQEMTAPTDGVTAVTGSGGITSTGGTTPDISITDLGVTTAKIADTAVTAGKLAAGAVDLAGTKITGTLGIANGGTGATTAAAARTALGATGKVVANIGDGTATQYTVTHNLGTRDIAVEVYRNSTPWDKVIVDVERDTINSVVIRFATAPALDAFRVVVVG